jgi:hypothetical protein
LESIFGCSLRETLTNSTAAVHTTQMRNSIALSIGAGLLALAAETSLPAQTYSNAVLALNPVAYWPLTETTAPPSGYYIATNLGTAGASANGYYQTWYQPSNTFFFATNNIKRTTGATGDGDSAMQCSGNANSGTLGAGQYVIFPRSTNGVPNPAVAITAPFSIEAWIQSGNTNLGLQPIVTEGRNPVALDPNVGYTNVYVGFSLGQYKNNFYFQVYNAKANSNNGNPEVDSFKISPNTWYHVVAVFDGSAIQIFANTVASSHTTVSPSYLGTNYVMDPVSPLLIGTGTEYPSLNGGVNYQGIIDEVAVYPTALSSSQISTHYSAVSGTGYPAAVLADSPTIYLRMDEPALTTYPDPSTYPVAQNYGLLGAAANGVYQPGTTPGAAGPSYVGFGGASSRSVAFNGFYGLVDVGGGALPTELNPTGTNAFTVATWFQGNPADAPGRFQILLGHSDRSWRIALDGNSATSNGGNKFNPANGPELGFANTADVVTNGFRVNDGSWHMAVGVMDGTNDYLYIDGLLAKQGTAVASIPGTNLDVALGGDPTYTVPTAGSQRNIRSFDGQLAQVSFWTNALSTAQIQSLYSTAGVPPYMVVQPTSLTNNVGNNISIPALVHGAFPLSYQWYKDGSPVSGQTNATLSYAPATTNSAGSYYLVTTNSYGIVTSSVVTLFLYGPPTIQAQSLTDIKVFAGTSPKLQVTALGAQPIIYQWSSNGVPVLNATNSTYTISNAQSTATYTCSVTNFVGPASPGFNPVTVTVIAAPTAPYPVAVLGSSPLAYFRLDEAPDNGSGDIGVTAYDNAGGYNAVYNDVLLGQSGYNATTDPSETAVEFGDYAPNNDYAGNTPTYLNFGTPNGGNAEFSVEAWVNEYLFLNGGNCIVAVGYGNGGEQFVLDTGATSSGYLRFFVRNAAGTVSSANSTALITDSTWHHVVGVCDEAAGQVRLYLDGALVGTGSITAGSGLLSETLPLSIGARESANANPPSYDFQFIGKIDEVALYGRALSGTEVQNHYLASGIAPTITSFNPVNFTTNSGSSATFTATVLGTTPLTYQWTDPNSNPIGQNTNVLTLSNLQQSQSGTYTLTVTNTYGTTTTNFSLTVEQGAPSLVSDLQPLNVTAYAGDVVTLSWQVNGSQPLTYQWYRDGGVIPGAPNAGTYTFTVLAGTNTYQSSVTNSYSAGTPLYSSIATIIGIPAPTVNPTNFTAKMKVQFTGYNRSESLSDFPVLVKLSAAIPNFSYSQFASATGSDLRFADASGTRALPYEIDQWNDSNGVSSVWVQLPHLASTNDYIWAYWGNPSDTSTPDYVTNGSVWVPASFQQLPPYQVVYHLKESGFPYVDSVGQYTTTNGIAPAPATGLVGLGQSFSGGAHLDAGTANLGNALSNAFTVSAWVNVSATANSIQTVWANGAGGYSTAGFRFYINSWNTSDGAVVLEVANGTTGTQVNTAGGMVPAGQWHLVTATLDHDNGKAQLFVDGNLGASGNIRNDFPTNSDLDLGYLANNDPGFPYNGLMDEARVRSGLSSSNWVWASWATVAQNSTFTSYSSVTSSIVKLNFQATGNQLILSWPQGTLQSAPQVTGPYNDVLGATSPYTNNMIGQQFYRVRVQ